MREINLHGGKMAYQPSRRSYNDIYPLSYSPFLLFVAHTVAPTINGYGCCTRVIRHAHNLLINLHGKFPGWDKDNCKNRFP
ncbi:hypothetical protein D3C71_1053770 [compost metagenome]